MTPPSSVLSTCRVVSVATKKSELRIAGYWKPIVKDHRNKLLFIIILYGGTAPRLANIYVSARQISSTNSMSHPPHICRQ